MDEKDWLLGWGRKIWEKKISHFEKENIIEFSASLVLKWYKVWF